MARVLRPGGRLVISCHRQFLPTSPEQLVGEVAAHGFDAVELIVRPRSRSAADVEVRATRVSSPNG